MRRWVGVFLGALCLILAGTAPALATYPAPWPDGGTATTAPTDWDSGWTAYTYLGTPAYDPAGGSPGDPSNGGTQPNGIVDVTSESGTRPSVYYAYDATNEVLFFRFRLGSDPFRQASPGSNNADPLSSGQWNIRVDARGTGFRTFIISLDGSSGSSSSPYDNINVYYGTDLSNSVPADQVYTTKAETGSATEERDGTTSTYWTDCLRCRRVIHPGNDSNSYYLDFQIPLSALTDGTNQVVSTTTPLAFGWCTSDAANFNNPFQKDVVYNGTITGSTSNPFPMGDVLTLSGGISQNPVITSVSANCTRPDTLTATVLDTLNVSSGSAVTTVAKVDWYYQPDSNGDGTPDFGTTPKLAAEATAVLSGTVATFHATWSNTSSPPNGTYDITAVATDQQGNQSTSSPVHVCVYSGVVTPSVTVSGYVYSDANHDSVRSTSESGTGVTGLYVKLVASGATSATSAATVDATTGAYSISSVTGNASYTLVLDTNNALTDITPTLPTGYIGTQNSNGQISVTLAASSLNEQDFGLFNGSTLAGYVFADTGSGGGTANDGVKDGTEGGIGSVVVTLKDGTGATTYDTATTAGDGSHTLYLPATAASTVTVVETQPAGYISSGGSVGNTGGTYSRTTATFTFAYSSSTAPSAYTGVNFGEVGVVTFLQDNSLTGQAGGVALFPHHFVAGSAGTVTFTITHESNPSTTAFSSLLYQDVNANGTLDSTDTQITGPVAVTAGQDVYLLVKEFIPASAISGANDTLQVTASFTYGGGSGLSATITHTDLMTVGGTSGVTLTKAVDKATAKSGDTITYTITYSNTSGQAISNLVIFDSTPAYTTFVAAANGTVPTGLTGVTVVNPTVGSTGQITWTFTGQLLPGARGTVTFQVRVK